MGTNYLSNDQGFAPDPFGDCYWDPDKFDRDLQAMEDLQLNTLKIMVPFTRLLSGPQGPDMVTLDEVTLRRLDTVVAKAAEHDVKLIIVAQHAWGRSLAWFTGPGAERSERNRRLVEDMWRQLVTRVNTVTGLSYKDDPAIMSWSLAVEIGFGQFHDWDAGMVPLWQDWLVRRYGTVAAIDAAWGLPFGTHTQLSQVELPFCVYPQTSCLGQYNGVNTKPYGSLQTWRSHAPVTAHNENAPPGDSSVHRKLQDYQLFRQTIAAQWIKVQADADIDTVGHASTAELPIEVR